MDNPAVLGGAACCLVSAAVVAVCSLGAVPPLAYGIRYNAFNKFADTESVYTSGRYFIGPMNSFLLFPASAQNVEFTNEQRLYGSGLRFPALHTRTKEGLALHMQVSLQYKLKKESVGKLYGEFNMNYESMFVSTIRDTLIRAAADYEAYQLWEERDQVGNKMQELVNTVLARTYAECWGLQLMVIELPASYDHAIIQTQVQRQAMFMMEFAQNASVIRAKTKVIAAEYDRKVKVIRARGIANATLTTRTAKATAKAHTIDAETHVTNDIKSALRLGADDLVEYQHCTAVQMLENSSVFFGFDSDTQVMLQPPRRLQEVQHTDAGSSGQAQRRKLEGEFDEDRGPATRPTEEPHPRMEEL